MECFKCGISKDKAFLFEVISPQGVVYVCRKCSLDENLPVIKKPLKGKFAENENKKSSYERLTILSGVSPTKRDYEKEKELMNQEKELKKLVEEKNDFEEDLSKKEELIPNFHWSIMRARRMKKITQDQLAKEIVEPVSKIKFIEKGLIPENSDLLISKLESYLGIEIRKNRNKSENSFYTNKIESKDLSEPSLSFDSVTTKNITIAEMRRLKDNQEKDVLEDLETKPKVQKQENINDKKDLTDEEINDLIFGKR